MPDKLMATISEGEGDAVTTKTVALDAIALPEGVRFLRAGEVPDGLFNQKTLDAKIVARLSRQEGDFKTDLKKARAILEAHGTLIEEAQDGSLSVRRLPEVDTAALQTEEKEKWETLVETLKERHEAERETIKRTIRETEVKLVQDQNEVLTEWNARLLDDRLQGEIFAVMGDDLQDFAKAIPSKGARPIIFDVVRRQVEYDKDTDSHAIREGESFAPATKQGQTWAGVPELKDRLRKDNQYTALFKNKHPVDTGSDGKPTPTGEHEGLRRSTMPRDEKIAFTREFGDKAFLALPA